MNKLIKSIDSHQIDLFDLNKEMENKKGKAKIEQARKIKEMEEIIRDEKADLENRRAKNKKGRKKTKKEVSKRTLNNKRKLEQKERFLTDKVFEHTYTTKDPETLYKKQKEEHEVTAEDIKKHQESFYQKKIDNFNEQINQLKGVSERINAPGCPIPLELKDALNDEHKEKIEFLEEKKLIEKEELIVKKMEEQTLPFIPKEFQTKVLSLTAEYITGIEDKTTGKRWTIWTKKPGNNNYIFRAEATNPLKHAEQRDKIIKSEMINGKMPQLYVQVKVEKK